MEKIFHILADTEHRPYNLPEGSWKYYQEWNHALFLHWTVPMDMLRAVVPPELHIDTFNGEAYISLVPFTMQKIRPKYLPAVSFISDFTEINLRTYIDNDGKKGVYFLNIEAGKHLSAYVAKKLSYLPYEKSNIKRTLTSYEASNPKKGFHLKTVYQVKEALAHKSKLDHWLTERYCLYLKETNDIYRYDIHHKEWNIKTVELLSLDLNYRVGNIHLHQDPPVLAHYSDGVQVVAWGKQKVMG